MTGIEENIIEISWIDQQLESEGAYIDDDRFVNTDVRKDLILALAEKFEEENPDVDWGNERDYYEEIEKYATDQLLSAFGEVIK